MKQLSYLMSIRLGDKDVHTMVYRKNLKMGKQW